MGKGKKEGNKGEKWGGGGWNRNNIRNRRKKGEIEREKSIYTSSSKKVNVKVSRSALVYEQ